MTPTKETPQPEPLPMAVEAEAFAVKNTPYLAMGIDAHRLLRLAYMEGWIAGQFHMTNERIKRERAREWTEDHRGECVQQILSLKSRPKLLDRLLKNGQGPFTLEDLVRRAIIGRFSQVLSLGGRGVP